MIEVESALYYFTRTMNEYSVVREPSREILKNRESSRLSR